MRSIMRAREQFNKLQYRFGKAVGRGIGQIAKNEWLGHHVPDARLAIFGLLRGLKETRTYPYK